MTVAGALLFASLAVPLAMLVACVSRRARDRMPSLLALAPAPALVAALLASAGATLVLPEPPFRMTLALDVPGAMLLGVAALLWIVAGAYASTYLRDDPNAGRFAEWWLLTLTGNLGVFIAADLVSFYLTFSVVSLAAYGLIVHDGMPASRRAGIIYVALAVLGEAFLLMAFVFMAQATPNGSLLIRDAVAALPVSPWRAAALALLILGFGLKIGLAPAHVWMPLAYTAAPIPAAAVLSGAAVKAGVIGFIRFLPLGTAMPGWGEALAAAGIFSAFYGVLVGITQENPKTILAYSSVSQMGLVAAALGMGLAAGDSGAGWGASFSAAHHVLVKGALFLAIGVSAAAGPRLWPMLPAAVLALGLGGLPFSGGMLAKLAVKAHHGLRGRGGSLGPLSGVRERNPARCARSRDALGGIVASSDRRGAGRWAVALGTPSAARAGGGCRGGGGSCDTRNRPLGRGDRGGRRLSAAMASGEPVAADARDHSGRRDAGLGLNSDRRPNTSLGGDDLRRSPYAGGPVGGARRDHTCCLCPVHHRHSLAVATVAAGSPSAGDRRPGHCRGRLACNRRWWLAGRLGLRRDRTVGDRQCRAAPGPIHACGRSAGAARPLRSRAVRRASQCCGSCRSCAQLAAACRAFSPFLS